MSDAGIEILRKGLSKKMNELSDAKGLYHAADFKGSPFLLKKMADIEAAEVRVANRKAAMQDRIDASIERAKKRVEGKDRGEIAEMINTLEEEVESIKETLTALGVDVSEVTESDE